MKAQMLINPKAGLLKGLKDPADVKTKLAGLEVDTDITVAGTGAGLESFIGKVKSSGAKVVIIAGGDGTTASVMKGLLDQPVTFGLIPTGSMNNIASSLGLSDDLAKNVRIINRAKVAKMDFGRVNGEIFIESVGIGLLANIMDRIGEQDSKKEVLKVVSATIAETVTANTLPVHLVVDGTEKVLSTVWLTVTNTGRAALAMVDPKADVSDHKFEIVYCEPLAGHQVAEYATAFLRQQHLQKDNFHRLRGKEIELTLPDGVQTHVDGSLKKWPKLHIEVVPAAARVFVP